VRALAVHGRTRACRFEALCRIRDDRGNQAVRHDSVIANGDVDTPQKALEVMSATGADAVMIGRAAQGRPWIFREISACLSDASFAEASLDDQRGIMLHHLRDLHAFYGEAAGVRIARKHIGWYCRERPHAQAFRLTVMQAQTAGAQLALVAEFFDEAATRATAA
jgi:tRNA-dihydrouridine synthase B